MPSRDFTDLTQEMALIWAKSNFDFTQKYPELPKPFLTCTFRSNGEQADLYEQGRNGKGKIVTYAKAGESKHNFYPAKAFDIAFKNADGTLNWDGGLFDKFAVIAKKHGAKWGGDFKKFKDKPHFELP